MELSRCCLTVGLEFVEKILRIQWNPVTRHFIEFVVEETKQTVSSNSNVILTRQTCGQRMVVASKRRALAFCFSVRIWYMIFVSKCREESDLGLCMSSGLAKRMPLRSAAFRQILRPNTFKNRRSCTLVCLCLCMCMCVCVCVCERERESVSLSLSLFRLLVLSASLAFSFLLSFLMFSLSLSFSLSRAHDISFSDAARCHCQFCIFFAGILRY